MISAEETAAGRCPPERSGRRLAGSVVVLSARTAQDGAQWRCARPSTLDGERVERRSPAPLALRGPVRTRLVTGTFDCIGCWRDVEGAGCGRPRAKTVVTPSNSRGPHPAPRTVAHGRDRTPISALCSRGFDGRARLHGMRITSNQFDWDPECAIGDIYAFPIMPRWKPTHVYRPMVHVLGTTGSGLGAGGGYAGDGDGDPFANAALDQEAEDEERLSVMALCLVLA